MNDSLQEILDNLEKKEPRSRLAPYRDLILELRRRNRTYREILQILTDYCKIQVSISTLYDFMRTQQRIASKTKQQQKKVQNSLDPSNQLRCPARNDKETAVVNDAQKRITALKKRTSPVQTNTPCFSYDPTQPLCLPKNESKG